MVVWIRPPTCGLPVAILEFVVYRDPTGCLTAFYFSPFEVRDDSNPSGDGLSHLNRIKLGGAATSSTPARAPGPTQLRPRPIPGFSPACSVFLASARDALCGGARPSVLLIVFTEASPCFAMALARSLSPSLSSAHLLAPSPS